jgi:hypothetical protein
VRVFVRTVEAVWLAVYDCVELWVCVWVEENPWLPLCVTVAVAVWLPVMAWLAEDVCEVDPAWLANNV